jgi:hypothetical protein
VSHHLDTPLAAKNGQLFIDDLYVVAATGSSADPAGYGQAVAGQLLPDVLPYQIGTAASFGFTGRNGRTLADNAPEVMLSLVTNTAVPAGLQPAVAAHLRTGTFPYVVPA